MPTIEDMTGAFHAALAGRDQAHTIGSVKLRQAIMRATGADEHTAKQFVTAMSKVWPGFDKLGEPYDAGGKTFRYWRFWGVDDRGQALAIPKDAPKPGANSTHVKLDAIAAKLDQLLAGGMSVTKPAEVVTDDNDLAWWRSAANVLQIERNAAWDRIAELEAEVARLKEAGHEH